MQVLHGLSKLELGKVVERYATIFNWLLFESIVDPPLSPLPFANPA